MAILSGSLGRQTRSILSTTGLAALIALSFCMYLLLPAHSRRHEIHTADLSGLGNLQTYNGLLEQDASNPRQVLSSPDQYTPSFVFDYDEHHRYHAMTDEQCDTSFPSLFDTLSATASTRTSSKIKLSEIAIDSDKCLVRVLVYQSELFIVQGRQNKECWFEHWHERTAGLLHSIHRSLVSAVPGTIPNAEFVLDLDDDPQRPINQMHGKDSNATSVMGLSRLSNQTHIWLMPDYAFWAWPSARVGGHGEASRKAMETNEQWPWHKKIPKAVWRGSAHINPDLREPLIKLAADKSWADVKDCNINDFQTKALCMLQHEHCRYRFPIHTEGYTYSGRLKYLQLCNSAPIIHNLTWAEFHTHLLRPTGPEQNFIPVKSDWSDLEKQIEYYQAHDEEAQRIARNNHETFAKRYLTSAATSCYWRRLIQLWASVQDYEPQLYARDPKTGEQVLRGVPFEAYAIDAEKPLPMG